MHTDPRAAAMDLFAEQSIQHPQVLRATDNARPDEALCDADANQYGRQFAA